MTIRRFTVPAVSDGSGNGTFYSPVLSGYLNSITYVKTDYTDGVDFTITAEATAETLWTEANVNAAKVCMPRAATHSNVGVASLYAATFAVNDQIRLGRDRVKIVIAAGGNATTGQFMVVVED